jgi:hypothetical protein
MNNKLMTPVNYPSKNDVIDTIINNINIQGISLELYRKHIEKSNLYDSICHLLDENKQDTAISDWEKVNIYSKIYHKNFPDTIFIFVSTSENSPLFRAFEYGGPIKPFDDGTIRNYIKDAGWFIK